MRTKNSLLLALQLCSAGAAALKPLPLISSQIPKGDDYAGAPAAGDALRPKIQFEPATVLMHGDSGNTGSTDAAGPLGRAPEARSAQQILGVMLWGPEDTLSGGRADITNPASPRIGLGAYDPDTLEVLAEWFPENRTEYLSLGYMSQRLDDNMLLIAGLSGTIYLVQREDDVDGTGEVELTLTRQIDVSGAIREGETLLNSMFDAEGNVWFTSGWLPSTPLGQQASATIGYVEPGGAVHATHLADQQIENGISVNGTTAYVVTGPLNGTASTVGYVHALTTAAPGSDAVTTVWRAQYDAGSRPKDTALSRGGGATPALLGGDYVVTTDNADGQIHLIALHQEAQEDPADQLHCKVPLFKEGAGLNDIRPTVHFDGAGYGVVIINGYGQPEIQETAAAILNTNGAWNDMSGMAGGVQRIDVDADGCRVRWDIPLVTKSVPQLSTATGLLYGYVQDIALAEDEGNYSWSFIALDWRTGETVWKKRSGAGGIFNDNFYPGIVGGGKFYQSLMLGVTWVEDGDEDE